MIGLLQMLQRKLSLLFRPKILPPAVLYAAFVLFPPVLAAQAAGSQAASPAGLTVSSAPIWSQDLDDIVLGIPYLQAESAVVACRSGSIKSFSMRGTPLWTFDPRGSVTPFTSRSPEGTSYVCNTAGTFMAINRIGRELWRLDFGTPITFPAVVGWDGRLFIPVGQNLYCRTASGIALWSQDLGSPAAMAPVLDHTGAIVSFLENRDFIRIDHLGAMERLRLDRTPAIIVPLISGNDNSYLLFYQNGEVENITLTMGGPRGGKLSRSRSASLPLPPAAAAGYKNQAGVTLRDGRVVLVSETGQVRWARNSHETTAEKGKGNLALNDAAMAFDDRGIFTFSKTGAAAFAEDGRRRWILHIPATSAIPAFSDEGLLYTCGNDRTLYTYKVESRIRNVPRSKYYGPDPEGTYGLGNPPPSPWANDDSRFMEQNMTAMYNTIEQATRTGQVGENEPLYAAYLMEMIGDHLTKPQTSLVRPPVMPPRRKEFINLLARMGSRETIPFLINIYNRDREPAIKAACVEAIGKIGVDPRGEAIQNFFFLLSADNANRDPQLLESAAFSIAALCRFSGPPLAADGILLLTMIARHPDFPPKVKQQAQAEINALRQEGFDKVVQ
jgi:outer membrane protein assembly factor BamB